MKKKALFVANIYGHLHAFHLPYIQMLKDNGFQVDLIAAKDDLISAKDDVLTENANNCYYWELTRSPFHLKNIKAYKQLKKLIEQEQYDLIHCHTAIAATITRIAAKKYRKKYGAKVLYTAHGFHFYKGSPKLYWILYYPVEKILSRLTDSLILINNEDYNLVLNNHFKNKKTYLINGIGINSKRFDGVKKENDPQKRLEMGFSSNQFLLIYVAEFIHRKNHKFLVDASLELASQIDNFKILFIGKGRLEKETKEYAKQIGADKFIEFMGYRKDLNKLIPICDIGISSSRQEGLPMGVAEEMFCGLPVIASQERGHRELIIPQKTGFLFQQNNISEFVEHVVRLYKNPEEKEILGQNAYTHVQKFKLEEPMKQMAKIYSETLSVQITYKHKK